MGSADQQQDHRQRRHWVTKNSQDGRSYFTNDVQFNTVVNFCGSVGVVATTAMNRWPSEETVKPRGTDCKLGILKSGRGALHSNPAALA